MTNSEFDKKLSDIVSEEIIPYNEDNWQRMQHMLDNKQKPKTLLLLPLLYKKTAAAAAIAAAITAWYLFPATNNETIIVNNNTHTQQHTIEYTTTPETITTTNNISVNTTVQIQTAKTTEKAILEKRAVAEQTNYEAEQKNENVATNNQPVFQFDKPGFKKEKNNTEWILYDEPRTRTTTFGINTGMAMYRNHNSFAAGLSISNKLSKRITINAGLGFVQGQQDVSVKHITVTEDEVIVPSQLTDTVMKLTTVSERYEQYSKRLPYLQFNPSVSVKLFDKLYVNAGADVQRIITSQNTIDDINKHLAENNKQVAATDFGATAGMGYMISKNIGMGVTYRHSLMNKTNDGKEYIKRNYFMVQLQYVFNRK